MANCVFCLQMWRITLIKSEVKLLLQRYTYWDIWNEIILRKNVCKRIFLCTTCSRNIYVLQIVHVSLKQVKYLEMMIFLKVLCRFLGSWKCFWIFYFLWSGFYYHYLNIEFFSLLFRNKWTQVLVYHKLHTQMKVGFNCYLLVNCNIFFYMSFNAIRNRCFLHR